MPSAGSPSPPGLGAPRRRAHALELVLDEAGDLDVRQRWARLEDAGVPSLARHAGVTHRPHVTLLSGPRPSGEVLDMAGEGVAQRLPVSLDVAGLGLLGAPGRSTLAELVGAPGWLRAAQEELLGLWPGADPRPWVPHLTLARRLPPASVAVALEALEALHDSTPPGPTQRRLVGLRWWDPDRGLVVPLGPAPGAQSASSQ